jgi:hypothetical protein
MEPTTHLRTPRRIRHLGVVALAIGALAAAAIEASVKSHAGTSTNRVVEVGDEGRAEHQTARLRSIPVNVGTEGRAEHETARLASSKR